MIFHDVIGQPFAVTLVERWLAQRSNQPLLFYGPEGVGKKRLALATAKALLCERLRLPAGAGDAQSPCGTCTPCRKISVGSHPDVHVVDLAWQALMRNEDVEKQQALRIETMLAERHRLFQSPVEGAWKLFILDDAHRLTVDAANVLLKCLEEPPADVIMILLTPFRERLLTTILSRCRPVRFRALTDAEMRQWQAQDRVDAVDLWAARGSPGRALHHSRAEIVSALREADALWEAVRGRAPSDIVGATEGQPRSAKAARAEIEDKIHLLRVPAARAFHAGEERGAPALHAIERALTRLRQNVQPALVFEDLLISLSKG